MKKVYQKNVTSKNGDCMQAVVASLFEVELDTVPKFIEFGIKWYSELYKYFYDRGFDFNPFYRTECTIPFYLEALKHDNGIDGYFYASVQSQTFKDGTHAVIVDINLNVVHDPNPNQSCIKLKPEDIQYVYVGKKDWHCDYTKREMVIEKK